MLLYEIYKPDLKKHGSIKKVIAAGEYMERNDDFIKHAFNFGNGTKKDMNEYMKNNSVFCVWIDAKTMKKVNRI